MYIKTYIILISLTLTYISFGQTDEIQIWKNSHPNILLIEENDANAEFLDVLEAKGQAYIVYNDLLTLNDIKVYMEKNSVFVSNLSATEKNEIKTWKANHSEVLIISQNDFDQMSVEKQQLYLDNRVLIYQGDELVLTDIQAYDEK